MKPPFLAAALLLALPATGAPPAFAQSQQASLVSVITDGRPWSMTMPDGAKGTITFNQGGTARMTVGERALNPSWRQAENGQLCLKPMVLMPERCATFRREGQAIVGHHDGKPGMRLTRP